MTIQTITIENFRSFKNETFDLTKAPRTLILGSHGAGKSTIFDAIRWCLTSVCRGTDQGGRGVERLRTTGVTSQMSVEVALVHAGERKTLTRRYTGSDTVFTAEGFHGPSKAQQEAVWQWLGVSQDVLSAILDGERFLKLGHAEAKSLLLSLLPCEMTIPETGETIDVETCESRYATAFEARKQAKIRLKDTPAVAPPEAPAGDIAGTEEKIAQRKAERDDLLRLRAEERGANQGRSERDVLRWETAIRQAQEELKRACGDETLDAMRASLTFMDETFTGLSGSIAALELPTDEEQAAKGDQEALLQAAATLRQFKPEDGCVLSRDVSCPQKVARFLTAAKAIEKDAAALSEASKAKQGRLAKLSVVTGERQTLGAEIRNLGLAITTAERLEKEIASHTEALERVKVDLKPAEQVATSTIDLQIAEVEDKIRKGEQILADKKTRLRQDTAFRQREEARKKLAAEIVKEDALCELYGPSGIRVAALAKALGRFELQIRAGLEPFGLKLRVDTDPWGVFVNDLPYAMLSLSEQWRVAMALQCAMAVSSGLGFTLVDQVDMLLPSVRATLTQLLVSESGLSLEQVILARAHEGDLPNVGKLRESGRLDVILL